MGIEIALMGDVMLGRLVDEALRAMRPEEPWGDLLAPILGADLRVINLECALTRHMRPWMRTPKVFHFRADPEAVAVLQAARVDACSLANNHTLDFEEQGLLDTLQHLDAAGIRHAGAGHNDTEAAAPAILDVGGHRVALVAATDNEPDWAAGAERPGVNYLPVSLEPEVLARVEAMIGRAKDAGAHTVLFSNHWGPNMRLRPDDTFRSFAHAVLDRGADVYYGHSAHLFQGVEVYRGKPILYDTGDFIDDYAVDPVLRNDWSFLFRVRVESGKPCCLELDPARLRFARVDRAEGSERDAILARMQELSAELGTTFVREADRLRLEFTRVD